MPASTSRTPSSTFSGVSRLMRPSSSSSPQSPQVEPGGRCFHRFVTADSMPSIGRSMCTDRSSVADRRKAHAHDAEGLRRLRPTGTSSSPPTCSAPACRSTCATARSGRRTSRSSRSSRAAPGSSGSCTRRATRAGRSPGTARPAGACPKATPSIILEDMDLDGVDVQVMHPNLSLFGLYSDDHELSMAHARVYNDYVIERFTPYFSRLAPDRAGSASPTSTTRSPRSSASPPAGSARSCCRRRRRSRTTRATSTRCGPRRRPTACTCSSTRRPAA